MKQSKLLLLIFCLLPSLSFAQYLGGNADGHSFIAKTDIVSCAALPLYSEISKGGNADGHSLVAKTDIVSCAALPLYSEISKGGNADGHSLVAKTDIVSCAALPLYSEISKGGNADGHSLVAKTDIVSCAALPLYSEISKGGNADGHSLVAKTDIVSCAALPLYSEISKGGDADGFSRLGPSSCLAVLPIELLYFTATLQGNNTVLCKWQTASEINNDYFTVEKTKDDIQYEVVGKMKGAGNSTTILNYSMIDQNPYSGISYYRLKQTDYDGKYKYSDLVPVNLKGVNIISIAPNPAEDEFEYKIGSTEKMLLRVKVVDILGQIVINKTENIEQGISNHTLLVSGLSSGTYILQIITENKEVSGKQFQIK